MVVLKSMVKVPLQKASVYQSVTRQNDGVLTPITFAVMSPKAAARMFCAICSPCQMKSTGISLDRQ